MLRKYTATLRSLAYASISSIRPIDGDEHFIDTGRGLTIEIYLFHSNKSSINKLLPLAYSPTPHCKNPAHPGGPSG